MCVTVVLSTMVSTLLLGFILIYFNPENVEDRRIEKIAKEYFKTLTETHDSTYLSQSGIDSAPTQKFAPYDNIKVSGTQVTTALSMFQGRDVAIVVQTEAFRKLGSDLAINYGAILTSDGQTSSVNNLPNKITSSTDTNGAGIITSQAKGAYVVKYVDGTNEEEASIWREPGEPNYSGNLHNTGGVVDSYYDTIGTTEQGNAAYIPSSGRFSSVLITDPTGSIIGIFFKQS